MNSAATRLPKRTLAAAISFHYSRSRRQPMTHRSEFSTDNDARDARMHTKGNARPSTWSKGLTVFARPASAVIHAMSHCLIAWRSPATPTSRSGNRIVCLILAPILLSTFATPGLAQPNGALAETSVFPTLAPLVRKVIPGVVSITVRTSAPAQKPIFVDPESGFPDAPY